MNAWMDGRMNKPNNECANEWTSERMKQLTLLFIVFRIVKIGNLGCTDIDKSENVVRFVEIENYKIAVSVCLSILIDSQNRIVDIYRFS